jgi:hypothetical protein
MAWLQNTTTESTAVLKQQGTSRTRSAIKSRYTSVPMNRFLDRLGTPYRDISYGTVRMTGCST